MTADRVRVGTEIPPWTNPAVDAQRMKTMAALLRDPYSVHWDREGNQALGFGGRTINQGPLNLGYIVNMLMAWQGPTCIRRLQVSFGAPVLDGDEVTATGRVTAIDSVDGESRATCDVALMRDGVPVVTGTATVAIDIARSSKDRAE